MPDLQVQVFACVPENVCSAAAKCHTALHKQMVGTAFALHCPGVKFDNKVLKGSEARDMEPDVLTEACKHGLTTTILYRFTCVDCETGRRCHCWLSVLQFVKYLFC